jgi:RimJ/RimL family protein N-acetyltransferase
MGIDFVEPTLRDCTYIGAHLRPEDRREVMCQVPEGSFGSVALAAMMADASPLWTWVVRIDDQPVAVFGFHPLTVPVWQAFALGTRRMTRAIPAITRWCWAQEQRLLDAGVRRLEARSIEGHDSAHRWLERLGCSRVCDLPDHGRDGELFYLYAWHLGAGRPSLNTSYRTKRNVHKDAKTSEDPGPSEAALAPEQAGG